MKYLFCLGLMTFAPLAFAFDAASCEESVTYEKGFNDGRDGNKMDSSFVLGCRADLKKAATKGYHDGYDKGYADYKDKQHDSPMKTVMDMAKKAAASQPKTVIVQRPGFVVYPAPSAPPTYTKWYCNSEAFGKTYDGNGPSES